MKIRKHFNQTVIVGMLTGRRIVEVKHEQELAAPMTFEARLAAYERQNDGRALTQRQLRQLGRMELRAQTKWAS